MDMAMFKAILAERRKAKNEFFDICKNYAATSDAAISAAERFVYYSELMVMMLGGGLRQCWFDEYFVFKRLFPDAYAKWSGLMRDTVLNVDWKNVAA